MMIEDVNTLVGDGVKRALKSSSKSQAWLAEKMDIKPGYLSELINGKPEKRWNADLIQKACDALMIPLSHLIGSQLTIPNIEHRHIDIGLINIIGEVQAGTWREARQWEQEDWQTEFFNASANEAGAFGLRVVGDSMDEFYPEGSTVVVLPINNYPVAIENGDHVVVERSRGGDIYELTIKELVIDGDKAELWPRSRNPRFKEPICLFWPYDKLQHHGIETVEIKGVVIGSINRRKRF